MNAVHSKTEYIIFFSNLNALRARGGASRLGLGLGRLPHSQGHDGRRGESRSEQREVTASRGGVVAHAEHGEGSPLRKEHGVGEGRAAL